MNQAVYNLTHPHSAGDVVPLLTWDVQPPSGGAGIVPSVTRGQVWALCNLDHLISPNLSNVCLVHVHGTRVGREHEGGLHKLTLFPDFQFPHFK